VGMDTLAKKPPADRRRHRLARRAVLAHLAAKGLTP